jgi:hypothetical protein
VVFPLCPSCSAARSRGGTRRLARPLQNSPAMIKLLVILLFLLAVLVGLLRGLRRRR